MLFDIVLLAIAYAIAMFVPNWRWWLIYAIVPVLGLGITSWALLSGSHDSRLMLLSLGLPIFVGAAGGLIVRALLFWRPLVGTRYWIAAVAGLALTIAAANFL